MPTLRDFLNQALPTPANTNEGSPDQSIFSSLGRLVSNEVDIDGTGAEVVTDIFTLDGPIRLMSLWGIFTDVTDATTVSGCYFDLDDGANNPVLTLDGVDCSGASLDALIIKYDDDGVAAAFVDADQIRVQESAAIQTAWWEAFIGIKNGATNKIRFRADTDANTDVTIRFYLKYEPLDYTSGNVAAS